VPGRFDPRQTAPSRKPLQSLVLLIVLDRCDPRAEITSKITITSTSGSGSAVDPVRSSERSTFNPQLRRSKESPNLPTFAGATVDTIWGWFCGRATHRPPAFTYAPGALGKAFSGGPAAFAETPVVRASSPPTGLAVVGSLLAGAPAVEVAGEVALVVARVPAALPAREAATPVASGVAGVDARDGADLIVLEPARVAASAGAPVEAPAVASMEAEPAARDDADVIASEDARVVAFGVAGTAADDPAAVPARDVASEAAREPAGNAASIASLPAFARASSLPMEEVVVGRLLADAPTVDAAGEVARVAAGAPAELVAPDCAAVPTGVPAPDPARSAASGVAG
jgi:hypothetical protein